MNPTERNQIYWRSRRGMLELELKLIPFVRERFDELSTTEQRAYEQMLAEDDWQIFDWLQGRAEPEDPVQQRIVGLIIEHSGPL